MALCDCVSGQNADSLPILAEVDLVPARAFEGVKKPQYISQFEVHVVPFVLDPGVRQGCIARMSLTI